MRGETRFEFAPAAGSATVLIAPQVRADVAQLVEHHLAKVRVAGSNPVVRSEGAYARTAWPWWPSPFMAEWPSGLGKGLQGPVHGFDSRLRLPYLAARLRGRPHARPDQAGLVGQDDHLNPVAQAELGQDPADVRLDRRLGHVQRGGDLGVRLALGHRHDDLALAFGQRGQLRVGLFALVR